MALVKLKEISQDTWLRSGGRPEKGGVCYYMCNFLMSEKGIWHKPVDFKQAVDSAKEFGQGTAMMNYAKIQNLNKKPQNSYPSLNGRVLDSNSIYRGELWVGNTTAPIGAANHEILIITGNGNDIIYFEPNFGFFQNSNAGMNNVQALEYCIAQQYAPNFHVGSFGYLLTGKLGK
ncbi:hypothetical protein [Phocaeicola barnesiae]|uniref:hypothetical protein n=1 Tax=Phocaeicola barnesiae TaxID=376804 RepID=UPI00242D4CA1|nr:hypothetical protein [Phocaeicola barnesiae]